MRTSSITILTALLLISVCVEAAHDEQQQVVNSTSVTKKLFTYTGPLLPNDWSLVSIMNGDRAVIGFNNGSARNALLSELDPKDRSFLLRLQNGTVYSTPLASAKEKISQWSSSASSTFSSLAKSVKEQLDNFMNKNKEQPASNGTIIVN